MKKIRKLSKKFSAGLLGVTLLASGAAAQNLGDLPQPFVDDDGALSSSIVIGEDAKTSDVVSAIDIAATLGNDAYSEETTSTEGGETTDVNGLSTETGIKETVSGTLTATSFDNLVRNYEFGDEKRVTEEVRLGKVDGTGNTVSTDVDEDGEVRTVVNQNAVEYNANYNPGLVEDDNLYLLGEEYVLTSVSSGEIELGSTETDRNLGTGDTIEHGPYTVEITDNDGEDTVYLTVRKNGDTVAQDTFTDDTSNGGTLERTYNDEFTVTADSVFFGNEERVTLTTTFSDLTMTDGEEAPVDEDWIVDLGTSNGDTVNSIGLYNQQKATAIDKDEEDYNDNQVAALSEGENLEGPNGFFTVSNLGLTDEAEDDISIEDEYDVTYNDTEGIEHTLDITQVTSSTSPHLNSANPYLDNGDDEGEIQFFSTGDNTWEEGSDAMVLDNDNDGYYSTGTDNQITSVGSGVGNSDQLSSFMDSDNVYATTTSGYDSSTDGIFVDNADNGYFDEEGLIVSATSASESLVNTFDAQLGIEFDNSGTVSTITLDNSGLIDAADTLTTLGLQSDAGGNIAAGEPVEVGSTGNYYITNSLDNAGERSTLEVIGGVTTSESNLKGSTVERQTISGQTDFGVQTDGSTSTDPGTDGVGSIGLASATDLTGTPDVNEGNLVVVDQDYSSEGTASFTDGDEQFFVVTADQGSSDSSVEVVGRSGATIPDGADIFKVTAQDEGSTADQATVDSQYLDSGTDIASAINDKISEGTASFNQAPYSSTQYTIESSTTDDGQTSTVSITADSGSGTSVVTDLNLGSPAVNAAQDQPVSDKANLDETTQETELTSGDQIKFYNADDEGGSGFTQGSDDVIEDTAGQGTFTTIEDVVKGGSGTPSNGDPLEDSLDSVKFSVDISQTEYNNNDIVAVDENDDGVYDSGDTLIAGSAPGGILTETDSSKTVYTDIAGHPVKVEWDDGASEATISYQDYETTIAPGESVSEETGYFLLEADFNDLNGDGDADLSVSSSDSTLDTQFGADISYGGSTVGIVEPGSGSDIEVNYDGSDEIDSVSFTDSTSDITEEDTITRTEHGSLVEVGSDMDTVDADVPENQLLSQHGVGEVTTATSEGETYTEITPTDPRNVASLDSEADTSQDLILVGGPDVNDLTEDLAEQGDTWTGDEYTEGEGLLQMVSDAFTDGYDALVVAGQTAEDTTAAGNFLADYDENLEDLEGKSQAVIDSETGGLVEE